MSKKKIVFVLPDLVPGGAERVMSFIAQNISKEKFDTTLWLAGYETNTHYNVDSVKVKYFNKPRVLKAVPDFFKSLRKEKPDLVLSSIAHVNMVMGLLSVFFPKTKFIGREANVLSVVKQYKKGGNTSGSRLLKLSYSFLDTLICQSDDMLNDMKLMYDIPQNKLKKINNPMTDGFNLKETSNKQNNVTEFITVARLKKQKGHLRIVKALSKLKTPYRYTIVGDGPEKEEIFNLINELGIQDNVIHIPYTNEVSKYLSKSDFFLQGSYVEGFPNCLIESCSIGTPIIAIKAPGGLNEIIEEGVNGYVAIEEKDFINKINLALTKSWSPEAIRDSVNKKFNKEHILKEYENLFMDVLNK